MQASATFDTRWPAQIQTVSRLDNEGKWTPQLSRSFLRYTPSDTLDLCVGRLGVDLYLDGDSRHVGYAFTAVRPSPEVLGMVTQDLFDGLELTLRRPATACSACACMAATRAATCRCTAAASDRRMRAGSAPRWAG